MEPVDQSPFEVPLSLRRDYTRGVLLESEAARNPIEQFARWFADAESSGIPEPNAMTLATADSSGTPSARVVLLKQFDVRGFTFYTNYDSRKGRELAANPRAALCFFWQPLERQVRIEGTIEKTAREDSEHYFNSRPLAARVGAWASRQSDVLPSREALERAHAEVAARYPDGNVPLPPHWGGYRVIPQRVEFWQGRASRLHDRLLYTRRPDGMWKIERLSP